MAAKDSGKKRVITDAIKAVDSSGKTKEVGLSGIKGDAIKTSGEQEHLLKQILVELKINNKILNEVHDLNVNEQDIKL